MAEQIISASGTQYGLVINSDGSVNTTTSVSIGSESYIPAGSIIVTNFSDLGSTVVIDSPATIGSLAIQTISGSIAVSTDPVPVSGTYFPGSNVLLESLPTDVNVINSYTTLVYVSSGAGTGISTGSVIGSIIQFIGAGSYVKSLTYSNNNLVNIGSWT